MYIKKAGSMFLVNFDHFDGIGAEEQDSGIYQLYIFKMNARYGFGKLEKAALHLGRYNREQTENILAEIQKGIECHKTVYHLPEQEVKDA